MSKPEIMTLECAGCTAPLSEAIVATGVHRCPYCGYVNILPREEQAPEVKHYLYNGDAELKDYAFERAYNAYSKAVELDPKESKAYFGMALSSNRVKYIKDVVNNRWQAICCEVTDKKFCEDANYLRALEVATDEQKVEYEARAKEIDYIREKFLELKNSGLSYDTFICVKVSDGEGGFTTDSHWAGKLYDALKKSGASPFYSEKEIGDRVGEDYEALILYALYTSKSMVIVCSNEDYLRTPWVQNEYTRYYSMMTNEEKAKNSIMIAFFGHVVEHIPTIPGKIQGVNLLGFGGLEQITEFVSKHANAEERARKRAEEKARAEAERKAKEEADEKARQEQQKAIEEQQRMLLDLQEKLKKEQEDVKYCVKCGAKNPSKVKFCSECASSTFSKANEKFCVSCETVNPISTKFCSSCGKNEFVFAREEIEKVIAQRKAREEAERIAREKAEEKRRAREEAERIAREKAEEKRKAREEAKSTVEGENADSTPSEKSKKPLLFILIALFVVIAVVAAVLLPKLFDDDSEEPQDATNSSESEYESESESESESAPASAFEYTVSNGKVTITIYVGTSANVEIPSKIEGYPVTTIGSQAFYGCTSLTSVTIPDSVTTIGNGAFWNCTSLTSVTIPDSVTSMGGGAFWGCTSLTSITIPDSVTTIGEYAFKECTLLESIVIPDSVTTIGDFAFWGCTSLTSITIPNSVTTIGEHAFDYCTSLTIYCEAQSGPSDWNSSWNDSSRPVVWDYIGKTGTTTDGVEYEYISGGVKITGYTGSSTEIAIPSTINGLPVTSIRSQAFYECTSLESVTIPSSVTSIGERAFECCTSLKSITVDGNNTAYKSVDGNLYTKDGKTLIQYAIGKTETSFAIPSGVTTIGEGAFAYCTSLTSVTIPNSVTSIGGGVFFNCASLTSIEIPNGVITIGNYAFTYCTNLTSVTIPDSVTMIGSYAFRGCTSLTIYCEAQSAPSGWDSYWCYSIHSIVWGHTHSYTGGKCVCGKSQN
ncbi:MAG: TIR domain-containing protein [Ruminococcaceae bacterium]|nr:TIR domain-containing protein [Oscillospiraceae bacterium]